MELEPPPAKKNGIGSRAQTRTQLELELELELPAPPAKKNDTQVSMCWDDVELELELFHPPGAHSGFPCELQLW